MEFETLAANFSTALIWGYGLEGRAVDGYLSDKVPGLSIHVSDQNSALEAELGRRFVRQDEMVGFVRRHAPVLVIKSPGISPYWPEARALVDAGAVFTSQTNLWLANKSKDQVSAAITGTKGKSTTSSMVAHILREYGRSVELGGNVGRPVCETDPSADIVVVEISSYQGADLAYGFDYAMLLNLDADHIPWHGDLETYHRDKLNILVQSGGGQLIVPLDEAYRFDAVSAVRPLKYFGEPLGYWVGPDNELRLGEHRLQVPPQILGVHNRRNLAAALTLCGEFGVSAEEGIAALSGFQPLAHRLEVVGERNGVRFVSDAIATTPQACWSAVEAFPDDDLVLILGGTEREQDYDWLAERLTKLARLRAVILIPDNHDRIAKVLETHGLASLVSRFDDFDDAIRSAAGVLNGPGVVLLSPAAPRGKAFASINARGERFRALVSEIDA